LKGPHYSWLAFIGEKKGEEPSHGNRKGWIEMWIHLGRYGGEVNGGTRTLKPKEASTERKRGEEKVRERRLVFQKSMRRSQDMS